MRAGLGPSAALLFLNGCVLFGFLSASASPVFAQVNLPPPPPPPIDNSGGSSSSGSGDSTPTQTHKPKPHKPVEPVHTAAPPPTPPPPPPQHHDPEPPRVDYETPRTTSIRLNPLPIFVGRLSADLELMLAPHHALVLNGNITFHKVAFERNDNTLGYGLGYSSDASGGFGGEVGYHYWVRRHLAGIYLGPSLILGATLPSAPAGAKAFAYYGGAFDVGYQYLFPNGFTLNGGGGIMILGASGATAHAAPRFLFGVGWSF